MSSKKKSPTLIRITTVPISLKLLINDQMKFMAKHGFEVTMISADGPEVDEVKSNENCPHVRMPLTRKITPFKDLIALWKMYQFFRIEKPEIVHTHTPKAGLIGMLAARLARVPIRLHTIAGLPLMTATGLKKNILRFTEKLTGWGAQKVLPNSKAIYQYMHDADLVPKHKLDMIGDGSSNGINLSIFSKEKLDKKKVSQYKLKYGISNTDKIILAVGRVVKDKGITELIKAFLKLHHNDLSFKLFLVGPFEHERHSEALPSAIVKAIIEHESIIHIPWSDEVAYFMNISDILVHSSYREGFPNVVLQAAAMELPIICSNIPGNIDIVESNDLGYLFEVKNHTDLYHQVLKVFNEMDIARAKSSDLRMLISKKFDRKIIHKKILDYYLNRMDA